MAAIVFIVLLGAALFALGIIGLKTSNPWYPRPKVSEENRAAFEKLMSMAQIIGGIGMLTLGVFTFLSVVTAKPMFMTVGMYLTAGLLAAALCLFIYTMAKYHK